MALLNYFTMIYFNCSGLYVRWPQIALFGIHLRDGDTPPTPSPNSLYVLGSPDRTVFYAKHIEVIDGLGKNRNFFQLEIRYVIRTCGEIPIHTSERF